MTFESSVSCYSLLFFIFCHLADVNFIIYFHSKGTWLYYSCRARLAMGNSSSDSENSVSGGRKACAIAGSWRLYFVPLVTSITFGFLASIYVSIVNKYYLVLSVYSPRSWSVSTEQVVIYDHLPVMFFETFSVIAAGMYRPASGDLRPPADDVFCDVHAQLQCPALQDGRGNASMLICELL